MEWPLPALVLVWCSYVCISAATDIHVTPSSGLKDGLAAARAGDRVILAAGTFRGPKNCGQHIQVDNIAIVGAGISLTLVDCTGWPGRALAVYGSGLTLSGLSLLGGDARGASPPWGGCLYLDGRSTGATTATLSAVSLSGGLAQSGGGLGVVDIAQLELDRVVISANRAETRSHAAHGGGLAVVWRTSSVPRTVKLSHTEVLNNTVVSLPGATSSIGGGVLVSVQSGQTPATLALEHSVLAGNRAVGLNPDGQLVACGGACMLNMDYSDPKQGPVSSAALVSLTASTVINNTADCSACYGGPSSANASNTGGVGGLVVQSLQITSSHFSRNIASCTGDCVAEGGALFLQGASGIHYGVTVNQSTFDRNVAVCNGPGCLAQGAGALIVSVANISLTDTSFNHNSAHCGQGTGSQGGAIQVQDGIPSTSTGAAAYASVTVNMTRCTFVGNTVAVTPPIHPYGPHFVLGAEGGAVNVMASAELIQVAVSDCLFHGNRASSDFPVRGKSLGGAWLSLMLGKGRVNASFVRSLFVDNNVSCAPAGGCTSDGAAIGWACEPQCEPGSAGSFDIHSGIVDNGVFPRGGTTAESMQQYQRSVAFSAPTPDLLAINCGINASCAFLAASGRADVGALNGTCVSDAGHSGSHLRAAYVGVGVGCFVVAGGAFALLAKRMRWCGASSGQVAAERYQLLP